MAAIMPSTGRRKGHKLAGIQQSGGIEGLLDRANRVDLGRARQALQLADLHLANTMFGGNRSARCRDLIVDEAGRFLAMAGYPVARGRDAVLHGRAHMEMDIAIAEMTEGASADARKMRLAE